MIHRWLLATLLLLVAIAPTRQAASAQETKRAAVVVDAGDGIQARCVAFAEPTLSGHELLTRAGFATVTSAGAQGQAVCAIDATGCPASDCFCQCQGADCAYWSYWQQREGAWGYAAQGAGSRVIADGDVDGWFWGPGNAAAAPVPVDFTAVCGDAPPEAPSTRAAAAPSSDGSLSYLAFGGIVIVMAGLLLVQRRREA